MAFQMVGQAVAVGLGKAKQAIFFSVFRKVIIVVPLLEGLGTGFGDWSQRCSQYLTIHKLVLS